MVNEKMPLSYWYLTSTDAQRNFCKKIVPYIRSTKKLKCELLLDRIFPKKGKFSNNLILRQAANYGIDLRAAELHVLNAWRKETDCLEQIRNERLAKLKPDVSFQSRMRVIYELKKEYQEKMEPYFVNYGWPISKWLASVKYSDYFRC